MVETFRLMEEFEQRYLPEYCKKYPIIMRVTKQEQDFIHRVLRGNKWWEIKPKEGGGKCQIVHTATR